MTQREIEKKLLAWRNGLVTRAVQAPLASLSIAFVLGVIAGQALTSVLLILVIVAAGGFIAYMFAPKSNQAFDDREAEDTGPIHRP